MQINTVSSPLQIYNTANGPAKSGATVQYSSSRLAPVRKLYTPPPPPLPPSPPQPHELSGTLHK
ncbi:hypothetical protein E4U15_004132 [Claviceps sp. LM218 group G6]|nr:hypothetical protein E4U15_004132 [Claviceps sp. LM218 group G6]